MKGRRNQVDIKMIRERDQNRIIKTRKRREARVEVQTHIENTDHIIEIRREATIKNQGNNIKYISIFIGDIHRHVLMIQDVIVDISLEEMIIIVEGIGLIIKRESLSNKNILKILTFIGMYIHIFKEKSSKKFNNQNKYRTETNFGMGSNGSLDLYQCMI